MEPFFDNYKKILPFFINESPIPEDGKERIQSPEQRARFDDTTKCILCAACTTSCPSFWGSDDYFGPAALVNAHRFIFDSRDEAASERLHILSETSGVTRCHTTFNCTIACPREIQITLAIGELKMAMVTGKIGLEPQVHWVCCQQLLEHGSGPGLVDEPVGYQSMGVN
jgi:succinate dehydrogenase / fumarate reductase iron-sulfur subunit